jgi:hypothetical protein
MTVQTHVQDMENVIRKNASVILDGMVMIVGINYVHLIVQEMENVIMEYVTVIKDLKEKPAQNMM